MKIGIVLQVFAVLYQYKVVNAIYGFGDQPEDPRRIRIYLEDDEKLLVPKDSKIEYINPVIDTDQEIILDKPPTFSTYVTKVIKKPIYLPPQPYFTKQVPLGIYEKPTFTLEDLRIKPEQATNYFGGYFGGHVPEYGHAQVAATASLLQSQIKKSPVAYGRLLRPILLLPNGWIQGVNIQGAHNAHQDVKPVTEERPDDLKFDFRTQTHSLR